jgi:hypothetical protein
MPEFTTVSVTEAQLQTTSGRQKMYLHEYVDYIHKLPTGQAGRLTIGESEKPGTIRRRLFVAAQTLGIPLIIKRSSRGRNAGIPDEQDQKRKQHRQISHSARQMRLITEHHERNPRSWGRRSKW